MSIQYLLDKRASDVYLYRKVLERCSEQQGAREELAEGPKGSRLLLYGFAGSEAAKS
jgi:hypothetical protein